MSLYNRLRATSERMVEAYGAEITIARTNGETYDPVAGTFSGGTSEAQTVFAIAKRSSADSGEGADNRLARAGSFVGENERELIVAASALSWVPEPEDTVTFEGAQWRILGVAKSAPGGSDIVYAFTVTR